MSTAVPNVIERLDTMLEEGSEDLPIDEFFEALLGGFYADEDSFSHYSQNEDKSIRFVFSEEDSDDAITIRVVEASYGGKDFDASGERYNYAIFSVDDVEGYWQINASYDSWEGPTFEPDYGAGTSYIKQVWPKEIVKVQWVTTKPDSQ